MGLECVARCCLAALRTTQGRAELAKAQKAHTPGRFAGDSLEERRWISAIQPRDGHFHHRAGQAGRLGHDLHARVGFFVGLLLKPPRCVLILCILCRQSPSLAMFLMLWKGATRSTR